MGWWRSGGDGGGCGGNPGCCTAGGGGAGGGGGGAGGGGGGGGGAGGGGDFIGSGGDGTTYARILSVDGISSDLTYSGCLKLPLKAGGALEIGWVRFSGCLTAMMAFQDTWSPAGVGGVFTFLPLVNTFQTAVNGRRRLADTGSLNYSATDVPDNEIPYTAVRTATYWIEYDQRQLTYFEYFAGSSLLTSDKMFGRLNRRYDVSGNELQYAYADNPSGKPLLRKITGLGGNVVPYFEYADETIDATHFAPITKAYLWDAVNTAESRTVYFEFDPNFSYPYLTKLVQPDGCVKRFAPYLPIDGFNTYRIGMEQDSEGYATYFTYASNMLSRIVEPEGRLVYYSYVGALTTAAALNRSPRSLAYQTNASGTMPLVIRDQDPLGNTTYSTYDAAVVRVTQRVEPNGNLTRFGMVGGQGTGNNRYAIAARISTYNGAGTYYEFDGKTYNLNKIVGPRHIPTLFPVVTYYAYDVQQRAVRSVDPLGQTVLIGRDQAGRAVRTLDPRGYSAYFNYNPNNGLIDSVVDAERGVTYLAYNSFGDYTRVVSPRWQDEGGLALFTTYFEYDQRARIRKRVDRTGKTTYYDWTSRGNLLATTDPLGNEVEYDYNGLRLRTKETSRDGAGNILSQTLHGYDIYKNRIRTLNPRGFTTYYFYDQIDRKTTEVNALGYGTYWFYDSVGNPTQIRDAQGNALILFYDPLSRSITERNAVGASTYFFYDLADNKTRETDPRGATTYFFYDALDRISCGRDALGNSTYYAYDASGNFNRVADPRGNTTYFFHDGVGRRRAGRNAFSNWTYYDYDRSGNLTRTTDARNGVSEKFYDTLDRVKSQRDAAGGPSYFFYDAVGNRICERDARGSNTYFVYDALRRLVERDDPEAGVLSFVYDPAGYPLQKYEMLALAEGGYGAQLYGTSGYGGSSGLETDSAFDPVGRLAMSSDTINRVAYFCYDPVGNLTQRMTLLDQATPGYGTQSYGTSFYGVARAATTRLSYDAANRRSGSQDLAGGWDLTTYDPAGNVTYRRTIRDISLPGYGLQSYGSSFYGGSVPVQTYFAYDILSRRTVVQDGAGKSTYFEYDVNSNLAKVIDADGHGVQIRYDALNRPDAVLNADGGSMYFVYDALSKCTAVINPRGNVTYFGFDALSRLLRHQDALGRTIYFEYDPVSNLSRELGGEGESAAFTSDRVGRRTAISYVAAGSTVQAGLRSDPYFVYDQGGNLLRMGDLWGLHRMEYDAASRPALHQFPNGRTIYFEYDRGNNLTVLAYPLAAGKRQAAYDPLLRQGRVQSPSGATSYFTYDALGNRRRAVLGNGAILDVTYDSTVRTSRWRYAAKNGMSLTYFDYGRDAKGLVTKTVREAVHTVYYEYDPADRLVKEIWSKSGSPEVYGFRYAYNAAGNRTKARTNGADTYYYYDSANQLTVTGTTAAFANPTYFVYDRNGALTDLIEPSGATRLAYNAAGLTARIRWRDATATYFFYDGMLRQFAMVPAGAATATYFLWEGVDVLQELNADGSVKEEHTHLKSPVEGIASLVETYRPSQPASDQNITPLMDQRGSICKWLKSDGTTVLAGREYDAFGTIIPGSAVGAWPGRFGYQGQAWMEVLSGNGSQRLLTSPYRIYIPETGGFAQADPLRKQSTASFTRTSRAPVRLESQLASCTGRSKRRTSTDTCSQEGAACARHHDHLDHRDVRPEKVASWSSIECGYCRAALRELLDEYLYSGNRPTGETVDPTGLAIVRSIDTPQALAALAAVSIILYGQQQAALVGGGTCSVSIPNPIPWIIGVLITLFEEEWVKRCNNSDCASGSLCGGAVGAYGYCGFYTRIPGGEFAGARSCTCIPNPNVG
jgi:YD repeat-containing protein